MDRGGEISLSAVLADGDGGSSGSEYRPDFCVGYISKHLAILYIAWRGNGQVSGGVNIGRVSYLLSSGF